MTSPSITLRSSWALTSSTDDSITVDKRRRIRRPILLSSSLSWQGRIVTVPESLAGDFVEVRLGSSDYRAILTAAWRKVKCKLASSNIAVVAIEVRPHFPSRICLTSWTCSRFQLDVGLVERSLQCLNPMGPPNAWLLGIDLVVLIQGNH